jgi:hypothetical protein
MRRGDISREPQGERQEWLCRSVNNATLSLGSIIPQIALAKYRNISAGAFSKKGSKQRAPPDSSRAYHFIRWLFRLNVQNFLDRKSGMGYIVSTRGCLG